MLWLQKETDSSAKLILQKLEEKYPGQFDNKLLRTLQRRIGEWRGTIARRLVFGGVEERNDVQAVAATVSVAGFVPVGYEVCTGRVQGLSCQCGSLYRQSRGLYRRG